MGCASGRPTPEQILREERQQSAQRWKELEGEQLEEPLREGWVRLVRADWLVNLCESGGVLGRRQDLPSEAFVDLDEVKAACAPRTPSSPWLHIIVLSYPWLQPGHPDPHGENLHVIAKALKLFVNGTGGGQPFGVLIDFTSLFQAVRTEEENRVFKLGLPALNLFYSHPHTVVLKVTQFPPGYPDQSSHRYELPDGANTVPYTERGWCFAESSMSGLVKSSENILDLARLQDGHDLWGAVAGCRAGRTPPLHPDDFKVELDKKTFTSKKDDFERVAKLYSDAFQRHLGSAQVLKFGGLEWGPDEVRKLLRALQGSSCLKTLFLYQNCIGSEGAAVLGEALQSKSSIQDLERLDLSSNGIGPEGAAALGEALRVNTSLRWLDLGNNSIGPKGAAALGEALRINTSLLELPVGSNGIGPEGAVALGEALRVNTSLGRLELHCNGIGPEGEAQLRKAAQRPRGKPPCLVCFSR